MNDSEFGRWLERYPVVRKKTYCRVQWNDRDRMEGTAAASSRVFIMLGQERDIQLSDSMEDALEKFLAPCFSSQEAAKIQEQLEKNQREFVSSLCLEDVNDLCAQFVTTE